jgi:hypothetical protein
MFGERERLTVREVKAETGADKVRRVASNTFDITYSNGIRAIRYHHTNVVTEEDGKIILTSGGWRTPTTKDRLTFSPSPVRVSQAKGIWYAHKGRKSVMFYDGITFDKDGNLLSEEREPDFKRINRVKREIAGFVKLITKDNLPLPSAGDCWLCSLCGKDGRTMGADDTSHLVSHIKEGYMHGSLLVNAMRAKGCNDKQIGLYFQLKIVDAFKRALRQYLTKRLLPESVTR